MELDDETCTLLQDRINFLREGILLRLNSATLRAGRIPLEVGGVRVTDTDNNNWHWIHNDWSELKSLQEILDAAGWSDGYQVLDTASYAELGIGDD